MTRYRKRPVEIEAVRVADWRDQTEKPTWLAAAILAGDVVITPSIVIISTAEGDRGAQRDDWIIRGMKGELYPCKPDIFAEIYEPVQPTEAMLVAALRAHEATIGQDNFAAYFTAIYTAMQAARTNGEPVAQSRHCRHAGTLG